MRYGVLGTGIVGQTVGRKLVELGHEVTMGSRTAGNAKAAAWVAEAGEGAHEGTFADAAAFGERLVNATAGAVSLQALEAAGSANLDGKLLVDISNPLSFAQGFPPTLTVCNTDSLGEQIQRAFPEARVVKTLNTVNATVMVDPGRIPGGHTIFMCGDDAGAKQETASLLEELGWRPQDVLDLGDITTARGTEMYLALWVRMLSRLQTGAFNVRLVKAEATDAPR